MGRSVADDGESVVGKPNSAMVAELTEFLEVKRVLRKKSGDQS